MWSDMDTTHQQQVEVYDETARAWLVFDDAVDAEEYSLSGDEDLIAQVVPLAEDEAGPELD